MDMTNMPSGPKLRMGSKEYASALGIQLCYMIVALLKLMLLNLAA